MNPRVVAESFSCHFNTNMGSKIVPTSTQSSDRYTYDPALRAIQQMYAYGLYGRSGMNAFAPPAQPPGGGGGGGGGGTGGGGEGPPDDRPGGSRTIAEVGGRQTAGSQPTAPPTSGAPTGGSTTTVSRPGGGGSNTAFAEGSVAAAPASTGGGSMTPEQARQFASQEWYRNQVRQANPNGFSTSMGGTDPLALGDVKWNGQSWERQGGGQHELTNFAAQNNDPAAWAKNYGYTGAGPTEQDLSPLMSQYQNQTQAGSAYQGMQPGGQALSPQSNYWIDKTGVSHTSGAPEADAVYTSPGYSASGNSSVTNGAPYGVSPENAASATADRMPVVPGPVRPPTTTPPPQNTPYVPPPNQYNIPPPTTSSYGIPPQESPTGAPVLDWGTNGASGNRDLAGAAAFASARDMYAHPDLAPEVQNAIAQQGMNATRAQFAGQQGQADRRRAVTGNSAGYAAQTAQLGRDQAGAYGMQARQNTIDFEKEKQRRKEAAQGQMAGLNSSESQYNLGLLGGLAGASGKVTGTDSAGTMTTTRPVTIGIL